MSHTHFISAVIAIPLLIGAVGSVTATTNSSQVNINYNNTSVSGLSAGGYMANQFHLSHADTVIGAGIVAAGPYYCAQGSIMTALKSCISKVPDDFPEDLLHTIEQGHESGQLAPAAHLKYDKVWMLHGTQDSRVIRPVSNALYQQYEALLRPENLIYEQDQAFAHLMPTAASGDDCTQSNSPFVGKCGFDAAGKILSHIYGELNAPVSDAEVSQQGTLQRFEQAQIANLDNTGMHNTGFVFIPNSCKTGSTCNLHISFHGCNQSIDNVDDAYAAQSGFNRWAASNQMIVLYPQVATSSIMPMNPQACWDWWGYTNSDYANKQGPQIKAVYEMMKNLPTLFNN